MDKKEKKSLPEPRTYTVEQIAAMLNIGRTTAYQLVKQEEFRIVRISKPGGPALFSVGGTGAGPLRRQAVPQIQDGGGCCML